MHVKHQWFGKSELVSKIYYSNCFFLINEYFLQFRFGRTSPSNVTKVYVTPYQRKINIFPRFLVYQNLARCMAPRLLDVSFTIRFIWLFHIRFPPNKIPKNLIWFTGSIRVLFIFNAGKANGMLSFCLTLQNNVNLVLSTVKDNLLLLNQWLILDNSLVLQC